MKKQLQTNGKFMDGWVNTTVWFGGNGGLPNKTMTNGNLLYLIVRSKRHWQQLIILIKLQTPNMK